MRVRESQSVRIEERKYKNELSGKREPENRYLLQEIEIYWQGRKRSEIKLKCARILIFGKIPNEDSDRVFRWEYNRPQLQKMISLIKGKQISTVVCYKLDRISRNVSDFTVMYNMFEEYSYLFFSATEDYNTSTPAGKAMLNMCSVFAQMERETIAERIRDNMLELAKQDVG